MKYVMALDQGTTSCRCILYDHQGEQISVAQKEFTQIYPQTGWVEHNAREIWETQMMVCRLALANINAKAEDIDSIGITNQRETTIVWDKKTGIPVYNAIVWQCRRTAGFCDQLKAEGLTDIYRHKTGLLIDPYFSGTKLRWILENVEGAREKAEDGQLLFGTIETWLIWNLTGGRVHVTDYSNASRTMMFNIRNLCWDEEILKRLNIPGKMLPEVKPSSCLYGVTDSRLFDGEIRICGAAGDQQAALFGQTCFSEGEAKNTFGTGGFVLVNTGNRIIESENGLLSTIAWGLNGKVCYALEGSVFVSGAVIQWLRDELGIISEASETENLARQVDDTAGAYVVPAFTGLGAPYWDPYARGVIVGLTRGVNKKHIARAALESMAYQTYDLLKAISDELGRPLAALKVDGGAAENDFLLEFQSDILQQKVVRPSCIETTSIGAAYLAGLATGYWTSENDVKENWQIDRVFEPSMKSEEAQKLIIKWHDAVRRSFNWAK
ncbi:MAG: glycerol kinase GlpK [Eubacteriales bacterium]|nr:glycerol kinase GlpK [Eubacteriales bacterium]